MKIAVIGAGIAGLGASWALSRRHDVTLFERQSRLGGHANTLNALLDGGDVPVDTGFIVYNEVNYPHLTRLFAHLQVPTIASDMCFAVSLDDGAWEMAGRAGGLFGSPGQVFSPEHWRLLAHVVRFFRHAEAALADPQAEHETLGAWLARHGYDTGFVERFLVPMAAAIWSSSAAGILDYPVRPFVAFFRNHGLLKLGKRVAWRTVAGGSAAYVARLRNDMAADLRLGQGAKAVLSDGIAPRVVRDDGHVERFDGVVLACHGDEAATLLASDSDRERASLLRAFSYQPNEAVLHTDAGLMPRRRRLWSSWNYSGTSAGAGDRAIAVTYWMNRLQGIATRDQVFVTLNPVRQPRPETVVSRIAYAHPQYDPAAIGAQRRLGLLQGRGGIWLCGSYTGFGFHEDGLRSGLAVAAALGAQVPWWSPADTARDPWTVGAPDEPEASAA
jgi:uncharacterized protein